jgi:tRNA A-37 threonylcarbamoyl transferase component Bud32
MSTPEPPPHRRLAIEPTRDYLADGSASHPKRVRCRFASPSGGSGLTSELQHLLRYRLWLVALIFGACAALFLLKYLWELGGPLSLDPFTLILHAVVVAICAALVVRLWNCSRLSLAGLRLIELIFLGTAVTFFGWLHYLITLKAGRLPAMDEAHALFAWRATTGTIAVRWVMLLIIYGTMIPATWRRSVVVVGLLALLPLVLTVAFNLAGVAPMPYFVDNLVSLAIILGMASTVAVFGSHRVSELRQQAFEAKQLGQYRLKKKLGSGGMGDVYLAEHVMLRRPCAIKLIRAEQAGNPTNLSRFEREVRATATLTHLNTVEIFDYGHTEDGTFYYVMEYLPGLALDDLVEQHGPLPPPRAVHFLRQVCGALREAHGVGLIHRDIKPSNILACERGGVRDVAKLLDFGLVQGPALGNAPDRLTVQGTILGSPPYMSPEQAAGKPIDARSDIYGLGGVAYFLLTGRPPFVRETAMEMLLAHAYEAPQPLSQVRPEVPADVEAIVLRCLEKEPGKRFADVHSLGQALAAVSCAGQWDEEQAVAWWQARAAKDTTVDGTADQQATQALSPVG